MLTDNLKTSQESNDLGWDCKHALIVVLVKLQVDLICNIKQNTRPFSTLKTGLVSPEKFTLQKLTVEIDLFAIVPILQYLVELNFLIWHSKIVKSQWWK